MTEPVTWSGTMRVVAADTSVPGVEFGAELSTWPEQKFVRGLSHLNDVMDAAAAWDAARHVWLDLRLSEDRLTVLGTMRVNGSPPLEELAVKLGDAVHNIRSALDALVWELCKLESPPDSRILNYIQFPCVSAPGKWNDYKRYLASMPAPFLERVRLVQPAFNGDGSTALQMLTRISNRDKHRGQIKSAGAVSRLTLPIDFDAQSAVPDRGDGHDLSFEFLGDGALEDGKELISATVLRPMVLSRTRVPIGVQYTVSDGVLDYELPKVVEALQSLRVLFDYITQGQLPEATNETPSTVD